MTSVKLTLLLILFAMLIVAGVHNKVKVAVVIVAVMCVLGAYGEIWPDVPLSSLPKIRKEDEFKYKEERDSLVGDYSTFNRAFKYYRAGNCICEECGLEYRDHPVIRMPEKRFYGCELHVLCNSDRVKL